MDSNQEYKKHLAWAANLLNKEHIKTGGTDLGGLFHKLILDMFEEVYNLGKSKGNKVTKVIISEYSPGECELEVNKSTKEKYCKNGGECICNTCGPCDCEERKNQSKFFLFKEALEKANKSLDKVTNNAGHPIEVYEAWDIVSTALAQLKGEEKCTCGHRESEHETDMTGFESCDLYAECNCREFKYAPKEEELFPGMLDLLDKLTPKPDKTRMSSKPVCEHCSTSKPEECTYPHSNKEQCGGWCIKNGFNPQPSLIQEFDEAYGTFKICDTISKSDHDKIKSFFQQKILGYLERLKKPTVGDILGQTEEYVEGYNACADEVNATIDLIRKEIV